MAYTFYKAMVYEIGKSILEADKLDLALGIMKSAEDKGVKLLLPVDVKAAREFNNDADTVICEAKAIPADYMGLDIGLQSMKDFAEVIANAKTIIWNGPVGVFEMSNFADGTLAVAKAMSENKGVTIIGGGDSAAAVKQFDLDEKMTHISTGGGASLEFLEGKVLPGVDVLEDK